ncbi:hypothetical protein EC957_010146 [Mortierella hygrophila]|uniref:SET domain-containing protein n=1 Tax=Mortierella hygrophila TaxID=979708 RepID=A0A9P6FBE0_9FUNG|nr:hypothetical protein EC957_010146 [Mortierella hygrophila]
MILKTPPNSSVCTGSNQAGESVSAVGQENTTTIRVRKLASTGAGIDEIDEQQDHNQGGDISLNSYDATAAAADHGRQQRPMALDQENSNKSTTTTTTTTVRASGSIHEHSSHIGNDSISNGQAERQKQAAGFSTSSTQVNDNNDYNNNNNNDEGLGCEVRMIGRLSTPDRGRIMVAQSMIPRGTFLYRLAAQATVCDTDNRTRRCASCLKQIGSHDHDMAVVKDEKVEAARKMSGGGGGGHGCEGCGEIWYCDHACADRDWEVLHAAECRFLKALYQGLPSTTNTDEDEAAWITSVGNPHREAITRFSQQGFEPYTQDYCRVLIRTLTHRFHEFTDPPLSIQLGVTPADPPYLESADLDQSKGPLPYSAVEDLVMNRESYPRGKVEGEFRDVVRILDAFQTHLEVSYLPRMDRRRRQHIGAKAMTEGSGNALKPPRRLLETELMNLVMREECNSFGMYEYPSFPLPPPTTSTTAAAAAAAAPVVAVAAGTDAGEKSEGKDNSKICYALGLFVRQHLYGFNHSCSPNLFHVAHNNQLLLYAARDIQPGEEINITYLEFGPHYRIPPPPEAEAGARKGVEEEEEERRKKKKEAFQNRRRVLKSHFYFDCGCARCTYEATLYSSSGNNAKEGVKGLTGDEEEEEERFLREGLSCEREGCFGFYAPPAVLRARQDNKGSMNGSNVGGRWGCVACSRLQS